jgi:hypothetical protein
VPAAAGYAFGIFAFVAFSDGKPGSTFPENALERFHADPLQHFCACGIFGRKTGFQFS